MTSIFVIFICFLIVAVALVGFVGNLVVIIVYLSDKTLRSYTNYFFVNLSITDILIVIICLPVVINDLIYDGIWQLGKFYCLTGLFVENCLIAVSSLTLISIGVERFLAISQPFHIHKLVDRKRSITVILLLWIISIIVSSPFIYITTFQNINASQLSNDTLNDSTFTICFVKRKSNHPKVFVSTFVAVFVFAPSVILTGAYLVIIRKLKKLNNRYFHSPDLTNLRKKCSTELFEISDSVTNVNKKQQATVHHENSSKRLQLPNSGSDMNGSFFKKKNSYCSNNGNPSSKRNSSVKKLSCSQTYSFTNRKSVFANNLVAKRKQTITICLISLAFFFCQIPLKMFQIFNSFYEYKNDQISFEILNFIFVVSKLLFFLHGMSNPIIYNLMSTKFSLSFRNVILCKKLNNKRKKKALNKIPIYSTYAIGKTKKNFICAHVHRDDNNGFKVNLIENSGQR